MDPGEYYSWLRCVLVALLAGAALVSIFIVKPKPKPKKKAPSDSAAARDTVEVKLGVEINRSRSDGTAAAAGANNGNCSLDATAPPQPPPPPGRPSHPQRDASPSSGSSWGGCDRLRAVYPPTSVLGDLLRAWNPNDVEAPPFNDVLRVFNGADPAEIELAARYRDCEVPFKVRDAPEIAATAAKWTDSYLLDAFTNPRNAAVGGATHRSESNHFMFWKKEKGERAVNYTPPTSVVKHCGFDRFLPLAQLADRQRLPPDSPHLYLAFGAPPTVPRVPLFSQDPRADAETGKAKRRNGKTRRRERRDAASSEPAEGVERRRRRRKMIAERAQRNASWGRPAAAAAAALAATAAGGRPSDFIAEDLPFFSTPQANFWVTNVRAQKGIQCRFGMRGVLAESHYDSGRNFVLMLRGSKRYVLNPPGACGSLGIITSAQHPSFRHSTVDWSDELAWPEGFEQAPAIDTIVREGEALYIPSYWFHFIQSLNFSVQCNARSGPPPGQEGRDQVRECDR